MSISKGFGLKGARYMAARATSDSGDEVDEVPAVEIFSP